MKGTNLLSMGLHLPPDNMDRIEIFLRVCLAGFSLLLVATSALAYYRVRNIRLLFITLAFGFFLVKGLLLTISIFLWQYEDILGETESALLLDFAVLAMLYMSVAKR